LANFNVNCDVLYFTDGLISCRYCWDIILRRRQAWAGGGSAAARLYSTSGRVSTGMGDRRLAATQVKSVWQSLSGLVQWVPVKAGE